MKSAHPLLFFVPQSWTLASCLGTKTRPERWLHIKNSAVKPRSLSVKTSLCTLVGLALSVLSYSQTILFQETFDDADFGSRGWYDNLNTISTTAEHIPGSIASAEYHWLVGATKPTSGLGMRKLFTPSNSVYVSYWVKYSANYTGSNKPYHPHEFLILTNENGIWDGPAFTHLTAYIEHNEGTPLLSLQDGMNIDLSNINVDLSGITENRAVCGCNGVSPAELTTSINCYPVGGGEYYNGKSWKAGQVYFSENAGPFYQNNWHHVEAFFQLNSISNMTGNPDGIVRYWYDGQLIIEKTNILMRTGQHPDMQFDQFMIAPYIGDGSPVDQTFWVDELTLATAPLATGINELPGIEEDLHIFPNPNEGHFTVSLKSDGVSSMEILCTDLLGHAIFSKEFSATNGELETELDLSAMAKGLYIIQVRNGDKSVCQKVFITE